MKSLVLLCFLAGLGFFRAAESIYCVDPLDTIRDPCVTCDCVPDPDEPSSIHKWSCVQTCTECPVHVVREVCLHDICQYESCSAYPDATCSFNCTTCELRFHQDGVRVQCGIVCPPGVEAVVCRTDPCLLATCPADPTAECKPDYCGGCNYRFLDDDGNEVNCSSGSVCPPGVEVGNCFIDPCLQATCPADPTAQCELDYCGGCNYRFLDEDGDEVNCSLGIVCPPGVEPAVCPIDPCLLATCPADPTAQCEPDYCGGCNYKFLDEDGNEVDCSSACQDNPCKNGGTCSTSSLDSSDYICMCAVGFFGPNCEKGPSFCRGFNGDDSLYEVGTIIDSPDGCNHCICTEQERWSCTEKFCSTPSTSGPPPDDMNRLAYIVISVVGGLLILVFLVLIVVLIACAVKSVKHNTKKTKPEIVEFNDYDKSKLNKGYEA